MSVISYIDPLDRPDLVPILDEAVSLVVGFGEWVIPVLIDHLEAGDIKAQLAVGHALGRIGAEAIEPLMAKYASSADPSTRTFVLYALGKVKSPQIVKAASLVLQAARSDNLELRDTATRAIGKLAESIPAEELTDDLSRKFLERLHANLADTNAVVRAKAVRSLNEGPPPGQNARLRGGVKRPRRAEKQTERPRFLRATGPPQFPLHPYTGKHCCPGCITTISTVSIIHSQASPGLSCEQPLELRQLGRR
jgi:hypothetical protein